MPRHRHAQEERFHPLFIAAQAGEKRALSALLTEIAGLAKRYALRALSNDAEAEDVVQEILISVHKALHTYDPQRRCMPWLAAIMHFRLNDCLRRRYAAGLNKHVPLEDVQDFLYADVTPSPGEHEYVNRAVRELPGKQQAVIQAMYHDDLSVAETGRRLGISTSAVKVTAHRAYKKLRERIDQS